jgi:ABC-2 type transport system ATP-binding protein
LRVSLALAFVQASDVMFLDEPMAHIDAQGRIALWEEIRRARQRGTAVVCSTHLVDEVRGSSDRLLVLSAGRAVALASPDALLAPYADLTKLELSGFEPGLGLPLASMPGVAKVQSHRGRLILYCRDLAQAMAALAPHARVHSLSAGPVTLEDAVRLLTDGGHGPSA